MNDFLKYSIWFICLVLLQEFLFNNIQFSNFLTPYVYVFLILILPFSMSASVAMPIAFVLGLSVDIISSGILGAHAAACVAIAYFRGFFIAAILSKGAYDNIATAAAKNISLSKFISYSFTLVLLHHTILFFIETFSFSNVIFTIIRILVSSIVSTIFIILLKYIFQKQKEA